MATVNAGEREGAEVEARDDRKSAERSYKQLVQIVAGNIFYDAAAAFAECALAINKLRTNQEIASGAVLIAQRGVDGGSDRSADGG